MMDINHIKYYLLITLLFPILSYADDVCYNAGSYVLSPNEPVTFSSRGYTLELTPAGELLHKDPHGSNMHNDLQDTFNTSNLGINAASFQGDGNFVIYDLGGNPTWASNTQGNPNAVLCLKDSGVVAIYQDSSQSNQLWSTTGIKEGGVCYARNANVPIISNDGKTIPFSAGYYMQMQNSGDLHQRDRNNVILWRSNTEYLNNPDSYMMFRDGWLTLKTTDYINNNAGTEKHVKTFNDYTGTYVCFADDAIIKIYGRQNNKIWDNFQYNAMIPKSSVRFVNQSKETLYVTLRTRAGNGTWWANKDLKPGEAYEAPDTNDPQVQFYLENVSNSTWYWEFFTLNAGHQGAYCGVIDGKRTMNNVTPCLVY
ncbi:hypothetical protein [Shewanella surugensis]|uniref:Bulb-type lectin domain-containing protein n=1 Tax=Shewanella surugensis TaxID=212020 RepID=A0ABT0LDR0_9GAMM|nr:hypothetical protein [Shewanella surugensis]MCL1125846.1 hypothetical protein [Shewanella surugensis]